MANFIVKNGELAGSATAVQMPDVQCHYVRFKARDDNAGNVYIGGAGVTKPDGTTDTTTGFQLDAGDDTGWIPCDNVNRFYRICDNVGDDLVYLAQ
jgi:uridylate kinase